MSPEDRAAEAQKARDEGDTRPASQIEAEDLAAAAGEPAAAEEAQAEEPGAG